MKRECSDLVNRLTQIINNDDYLNVEMSLVGSGAKSLITQNGNKPIDLDFNIEIVNIDGDINAGRTIKEYIRKNFNLALASKGWRDCKDSTSVLTTEKRVFNKGNKTSFSVDVAIVTESNGKWYRLIHQKTGRVDKDHWIWNECPNSKGLKQKIEKIKKNNCWLAVRDEYLEKKNFYLTSNDNNHPSFVCYIEAVNNVYNQMRQKYIL